MLLHLNFYDSIVASVHDRRSYCSLVFVALWWLGRCKQCGVQKMPKSKRQKKVHDSTRDARRKRRSEDGLALCECLSCGSSSFSSYISCGASADNAFLLTVLQNTNISAK